MQRSRITPGTYVTEEAARLLAGELGITRFRVSTARLRHALLSYLYTYKRPFDYPS